MLACFPAGRDDPANRGRFVLKLSRSGINLNKHVPTHRTSVCSAQSESGVLHVKAFAIKLSLTTSAAQLSDLVNAFANA
ncbi:hypothetical protein FOT72_08255 [Citrobacter amalonaticus]|uniref:Uncharacterized protein n=1 Tax=Citrobacter amalonaticus TaxID=35703 RepID=A0A8I0SXX6_CITAM|nr:hypothetical protein [Salmonella enterica subsp. enterica serovar Derby]ECQ2770848.1 hypothetical protein [Salmonella enterica]EDW7940919.1 hypothetical protein [Salmonella enterica subsp. enterica serovar Ruiru]MBE0128009.1 hypothetical protein [Citrobacter amalonaticus]HBY3957849.1 hypothetical protein [Klebsiella quasipneumoniae]